VKAIKQYPNNMKHHIQARHLNEKIVQEKLKKGLDERYYVYKKKQSTIIQKTRTTQRLIITYRHIELPTPTQNCPPAISQKKKSRLNTGSAKTHYTQ
jgi:hypothetical protein